MPKAATSSYLRASLILAFLGFVAEIVSCKWNVNLHGYDFGKASWKNAQFWQTAAHFHFVHALVLYYLAEKGRISVWWVMFAGVLGFSGGLYLLATTGLENSDAVSCIGEVTLLVAWGALAFGALPTAASNKAGPCP